jgi:hypothetical protein
MNIEPCNVNRNSLRGIKKKNANILFTNLIIILY